MEAKYFTNPKISKLLQERGVVSQFQMGWKDGKLVDTTDSIILKAQPAYHFSDLFLYDNSLRAFTTKANLIGDTIWGRDYPKQCIKTLLNKIHKDLSWQHWLLSELTK